LHASMGHEHGTGEGTGKTPQAPEKPVEPSASQPHKH
jgi:hypothetical protein